MRPLPSEFSYLQGKILSAAAHAEFFALSPTDRVVNLGFGDGPQAVVYAGRFASMLGVDVNAERLARASRMLDAMGITGVELLTANVESVPRSDASFDAALACDIIEHVEHPDRFLAEAYRLLKPGGRLLVTFPAMHDAFTDAMSAVGKVLGRPGHAHPEGWHPDHHQRELPVREWRAMTEAAGFTFVRSSATTLFPPLHLYGVPKVWFSVRWIRAIDRALCRLPGVQLLGQTVMAEFVKSAPHG